MSKDKITLPSFNEAEYKEILHQAISQIREARILIARQVNSSTQSVYWHLGKLLSERQLEEGYGSGVVKQLSIDLKNEFPDMGLSPRNLWDMKRFYERYYQVDTKLRQAVAVLPWGHNLLLINKIKDDSQIEFYASETLNKGWSRDLLLNAIKMDSYSQAQKQIKHTILTRRSPRHMPIMPTKYSEAPTIWDFWALRNPLKNWNWKTG